jgi:hypothetical protein
MSDASIAIPMDHHIRVVERDRNLRISGESDPPGALTVS